MRSIKLIVPISLLMLTAACSTSSEEPMSKAEAEAICAVGLEEARMATGATAFGPRHNMGYEGELCYYDYATPGDSIGSVTTYVTYETGEACTNRSGPGVITNQRVDGGMIAGSTRAIEGGTVYGISACTTDEKFYHMRLILEHGAAGTWSNADSLRVAKEAFELLQK